MVYVRHAVAVVLHVDGPGVQGGPGAAKQLLRPHLDSQEPVVGFVVGTAVRRHSCQAKIAVGVGVPWTTISRQSGGRVAAGGLTDGGESKGAGEGDAVPPQTLLPLPHATNFGVNLNRVKSRCAGDKPANTQHEKLSTHLLDELEDMTQTIAI